MKLLHIDSSILGANSVSREVTAAVVERLLQENPALELSYRDLAAAPLSHLTLERLPVEHPLSTMASSGNPETAGQDALDEFLAADVVVIGAPTYNFAIPGQLKAWLDRLLVPGKTFKYGPEGRIGLIGDKRIVIVVSRGLLRDAGAPDHVEAYLRTVFGFMGVTAPDVIVAEGIHAGRRDTALADALQSARALSPVAPRQAA